MERCRKSSRFLHTAEDGVEFGIGDMEGVVVALKIFVVVEEKGEALVDLHRRKMLVEAVVGKTEKLRELAGSGLFAASRHDVVAELNRHGGPPRRLESLTKRFLRHVSQIFRPRDFLCHTRC